MRVVLLGASGRMGRQMLATFQSVGDIEVVAVDKSFSGVEGFECVIAKYHDLNCVTEKADVAVDFSLHTGTKNIVEFATARKIPLVVATTGHTDDEMACIERASRIIAVFKASNMSIWMAYMKSFAAKLATIFPCADVEIIEAHHSKKIDFPSGTALSIAKRIVAERGFGEIVVGRSCGREKGEVNVHSLRLGECLGKHEVIVDTGRERIMLEHEVFSRETYADGAMKAIRFILSKNNGLFGIEDILL